LTPVATTEQAHIVRIRNFPSRVDADVILRLLAESRVTGVLELHMSQGSICAIKMVEKQSLDPEFPILAAASQSSSGK